MSLLDKVSLCVTPNAYKTSKLYSVVPNTTLGDMDVVRGTTATRVNSAGLIESVGVNIPRIDYTNASCPSILVEPERMNRLTYSEQFENVAWLAAGAGGFVVTTNSTTAPNGTLTADKLIAPLVNQTIRQNVAAINTAYTLSVYLKTNSGTKQMRLFINDTVIQSTINVTSDWQRFTLSGTTGGVLLGSGRVGFSNIDILNESSFVYAWGAQLEIGSYATSYIPTVATVTRNADVISKTGISSLIGQTEGTMFLNLKYLTSTNFESDVRLNDGTANNTVSLFNSGLTPFVSIKSNNVQQVSFGLSPFTINSNQKIAITYKNNEFKVYQNGVLKLNQLTGNAPLNLSSLILSDGFRINALNSVQLYKTALSSTELTQLTTL